MSDIRAQYKILTELKTIEEKIHRLTREIEDLPKEIQTIDAKITASRLQLDTAKIEQAFSEKNLRRAELDLKEREEKLKKAQDKMMEVKTNEEYQASMKENESQKQEKGAYEEVVIRLMSEIDEKKKKSAALLEEFATGETVLLAEKKKCEDERLRVLQLLEEHIGKRVATIKQLAPDVATLYNRTLDKLKSIPIVMAHAGRCDGCHMVIRHQLFNEILGFKAIHRCANCGRILILPEAPPEQN
ncbi:MAG: hypothetical protein HYZ71_08490 [Deltaproteobacteria bacterium]|nr:hypothetical protein [Deltaproteobacteria bacterium]